MELDNQQVEVLGRNIVVNQLTHEGIEVAEPVRDRGVDLVAYLSKEDGADEFYARPLQLKVSSHRGFSIRKKYLEFNQMYVVYVWRVAYPSEESEIYVLDTDEMEAVGNERGWTTNSTWLDDGRWDETEATEATKDVIKEYRVHPGDWRDKLFSNVPA
jgi:hypothetical protein